MGTSDIIETLALENPSAKRLPRINICFALELLAVPLYEIHVGMLPLKSQLLFPIYWTEKPTLSARRTRRLGEKPQRSFP